MLVSAASWETTCCTDVSSQDVKLIFLNASLFFNVCVWVYVCVCARARGHRTSTSCCCNVDDSGANVTTVPPNVCDVSLLGCMFDEQHDLLAGNMQEGFRLKRPPD